MLAATAMTNYPVALNRILKTIRSMPTRVKQPPKQMSIESNGESLAVVTGPSWSGCYDLPSGCRSITLRDEGGTIRAHLLLPEQIGELFSFQGFALHVSPEMKLILCEPDS